jgi:biopolymer transport protein TolQ
MLDLILGASLIVQLLMLALVLGSVASWAIIFFKIRELRRAESATLEIVEAYQERPMEAVYDVARRNEATPIAALFLEGYRGLHQLQRGQGREPLGAEQVETVLRRLEWVQLMETQRAERGLSFLATTGSTAPFLGLLGTVIGIMNAFQRIGITGNATIATVGPDIAEALLATAIGLFAAIPAVIGFNYLSARVGRLGEQIGQFRTDFTELLRGSLSRAA